MLHWLRERPSSGLVSGRPGAPRRGSVLPRRLTLARRRLATIVARSTRSLSARNLVSLLGAIVALTTALSIPVGYGIIGYFKEASALPTRRSCPPLALPSTSTRPTRRGATTPISSPP